MATDVGTLLDGTERELAPLERAYNLAEWGVATAASEEHEQALVAASLAYDRAIGDEARYQALAAASTDGGADAALDRRRLRLLRNAAESRRRPPELAERIVRLEAGLASLYSTHRGEVDGRPVSVNEIEELLRDSTDARLRRAAYAASKSIGPLAAPQLRTLARLRNEAAQALGHRDHFAMSLALDELDEDWLFSLLDELHVRLGAAWTREKAAIDEELRRRLGRPPGELLQAWDYGDPFFQSAPPIADDALPQLLAARDPLPLAQAYFEALGEPVAAILERSDLYPRERKSQHAFCLPIDRREDVRVLANVVPGERWLDTMLHELGHAVFERAIDASLPWTLRTPAHLFVTEAIAMLHGRRARDAAFLRAFAGLGDAADDPRHGAVLRRGLHVFVAWVQVVTRFERALYADPEADLGRLWWQLVERYQQVPRPAGTDGEEWAAKQHLALSPVYYQNYLLGELTASQLEWALAAETGHASPAADPGRAGRFLHERIMRPGASLGWDELIERATGAPLGPARFVAGLL